MLLSLLSRRTLEADSRDSYGFAVRPQHLQRYREYGSIYKEEEEERSDRWESFLKHCSQSAQSYNTVEEHFKTRKGEDTFGELVVAREISKEGDDPIVVKSTSTNRTSSGSEKEIAAVKEIKHDKVQTWVPIRPPLIPIQELMSVRIKKKHYIKNKLAPIVQTHLQPIKSNVRAREKSKENLEVRVSEVGSEESYPNIEVSQNSSEDEYFSEDSQKAREDSLMSANSYRNDTTNSNTPQDRETRANNSPKIDGISIDDSTNPEPFFPWKEELESLVNGGIPKSLRGEVWQAFVGVRVRRVEKHYQELVSLEVDTNDCENVLDPNGSNEFSADKWIKQIEKDLPRTFPGHPALNDEGRNSLRRILTAYARHNPSVGYCQAMNFFAGLLLLLMPEENAFWTLVGLIDDYFDGYFTQEMVESQVDQLVFEELMRERFPKLVNHLDYLGVEVAWLSGPWFLSIFVNMLPWESVLRVWDVLLFEGNRVMLFRTALALMEFYGPALITTKDAGDAVTLLQSLTGSTFDSSQLVLTACMGFLSVTETRLEELRRKHRPSVLGTVEERTEGNEVSRSKSLVSKLYSFKHDSPTLRKDPNKHEGLVGRVTDSASSETKSLPDDLDEFLCSLSIDSELESLPDLQEQVVWLKVELCRLMDEKRSATLRAEELEIALLEMVKQDNRRQLSARVEQLEQEVDVLRQRVQDKQEEEEAMLQVLVRVEQEQKVTEDARTAAEQVAIAQQHALSQLQEKYDKAMASLAEMEKRVIVAESMLEATLEYESSQAKAGSPRRSMHSTTPQTEKRTGMLSFALSWRDKNKYVMPQGKSVDEERLKKSTSRAKSVKNESKASDNIGKSSED